MKRAREGEKNVKRLLIRKGPEKSVRRALEASENVRGEMMECTCGACLVRAVRLREKGKGKAALYSNEN